MPRSFTVYKTAPLGPWPYGEMYFFQSSPLGEHAKSIWSSPPGEHAKVRWSSLMKYAKKFRRVQNNHPRSLAIWSFIRRNSFFSSPVHQMNQQSPVGPVHQVNMQVQMVLSNEICQEVSWGTKQPSLGHMVLYKEKFISSSPVHQVNM